jgi:hypothetical protein
VSGLPLRNIERAGHSHFRGEPRPCDQIDRVAKLVSEQLGLDIEADGSIVLRHGDNNAFDASKTARYLDDVIDALSRRQSRLRRSPD